MTDVASLVIFLAGLALVTVVCVVLARRLGGRPRTHDHATSLHGQRQAAAQRDNYKGQGSQYF